MRRPPEVGQAGLLVILLLGASGCTGFPQRTIGTAPGSAPPEGQSVSRPGLFSWWHRSSSQNAANETASAGGPEMASAGQRHDLAGSADGQSLARITIGVGGSQLPSIQPDLERGTDRRRPEAGGPADELSTSRDPNNQPMSETPETAAVPRSDRAVRPTEGPSSDDNRSNANRSGPRAQNLDDLPFSPTPPPVKSPRQSAPEPANETPAANDERAVPIPADVTENAERAALQPKRNPPAEVAEPPKEIEPDSAVDRTSSEPQTLDALLPAPTAAGPQAPVNTDPGNSGTAGSTTATVEKPAVEPQPAPQPTADTRMNPALEPQPAPEPPADTRMAQAPQQPTLEPTANTRMAQAPQPQPAPQPTVDTRMAQAPPPPTQRTTPAPAPPPPAQRTPTAPAPPSGDRPASTPPEPPAPAAAAPAEAAKPAEGAAPTPPPASAPAPTSVTGQAQAQLPPASVPHDLLVPPARSVHGPGKRGGLRDDEQVREEALLLEGLDS